MYRAVFNNEGGRVVLSDLNALCCGTDTTFNPCPYEHARMAGRREVFLELMTMLKVDINGVFDEYLEDFQ